MAEGKKEPLPHLSRSSRMDRTVEGWQSYTVCHQSPDEAIILLRVETAAADDYVWKIAND